MFGVGPLLQHGCRKMSDQPHHLLYLQLINNMSTSAKNVELSVSPISCLHDEPIHIQVTGLSPNQEVTLFASMKDVRGTQFISYAHYRANNGGLVDVNEMESQGGHYEGVFPMGLIGSLLPAPHEYKYTRFFKRDVDKPNVVTISVLNGFLDAETLCSPNKGETLTSVAHERHYMAPGVQRIPVRYKSVRGCLFLPPGDGPFPGVVDMFGTAGGLLEYRSAQLASRGFASLALALFSYEDLPKGLEEFNISYFEEAVEFLLKHKKVLDSGVGVIGTSKGGDLALSLAAFIPSVLACVPINGFCAPVNVGIRVKDREWPPLPSWHKDKIRLTDEDVIWLKHAVIGREDMEKYILPIEKSNAAFLFLVGSDDVNVNSEYQAQVACNYLAKHKYRNDYKVASFVGTGHLLEPPYSSHCFASFQHTFMLPIAWGGSTKYHIAGQEKAWEMLQEFLWLNLVEKTEAQRNMNQRTSFLRSQL